MTIKPLYSIIWKKDNPIIPTIQVVARYGERDSEIKEAVIKEVLDNPKLSVKFF